MKKIVQVDDHVLRQVAAEVPVDEILGSKIQGVIADMREAVANESDGAALAAPQIGISLRIFVLSERVFGAEGEHADADKSTHFVFINPKIVKRSRKRSLVDEGCLSVRGKYGTIKRAANATVQAYDEHGNLFTRGAGGLLAQAFQHECDHLEGKLFIDNATEVWEIDVSESK